MRGRNDLLLAVLLLGACQVQLSIPRQAGLECASDAECPGGLVCALEIGRCIRAERRWTFTYRAKSSDPEGSKAINVTLIDVVGKTNSAAAEVVLDFTHLGGDLHQLYAAGGALGAHHGLRLDQRPRAPLRRSRDQPGLR